ncbi:hypothetical protein GPECTOR_218g461 [Gonium pectorale]|uniref:Uncharacterized protein n=1 Tax=Gonium pectorale TaxID=33097 RepID=A0A150FWT0_GONPE|nr:hypothetical protein GPECTOR_218g461 [Gonium pectorale]|eukprot:KXZ42037.1 hypothetical protein GPECTOR_218g461 [Gonium pectorale]
MVRELAPQTRTGQYSRPAYSFGSRIGDPQFPPEAGRYHLYLGNACPWCHRVALAAVLRGMFRPVGWSEPEGLGVAEAEQQQRQPPSEPSEPSGQWRARELPLGPQTHTSAGRSGTARPRPIVGFTRLVDDPTRARRGGWVFGAEDPDPVFRAADLWQVYDTCQPGFRGRCTAPLLLDARGRAAVCNESADIVRCLDAVHLPGCTDVTLRPQHLAAQIDGLNAKARAGPGATQALGCLIYSAINNGVYRSGFATTQEAYDAVQAELWPALDEMEQRLRESRFLLGDRLTESDVWLFPTVIRLDAMYGPLFKCGRKRVFGSGPGGFGGDYPALAGWARDIWQLRVPGSLMQVRHTLNLDAARSSYFSSLFPLNPSGIVPSGPTAADLGLEEPAGRGAGSSLHEVCFPRAG